MEDCLIRIAEQLNKAKIKWALGASMLLNYKGLVSKVNDLDMVIALQDIDQAELILNKMGTKEPPNPHQSYATRYFAEYVINGVEVDVMAGFRVVISDLVVEYLPALETFENITLKDVDIKLCPLEDWFVLYLLMPRREARASLIRKHLLENGFSPTYLEAWLRQELPSNVFDQITLLLAQA